MSQHNINQKEKHMPNVHVVVVKTKRMGGGAPSISIYFVNESDLEEAKRIIRELTTNDQEVSVMTTISESICTSLNIPSKGYRLFQES